MKNWKELSWWNSKHVNEVSYDTWPSHVFPPKDKVYRAFDLTPFDQVKCVILGQDPYPTRGHANGLAFSVSPDVKPLPSTLRNIFREYTTDLHYPFPRNGDLSPWAQSGVLLFNTILTVESGKPLSHKGKGWEKLTVEVISKLNKYSERKLAFVLWGRNAQEYRGLIDETKHTVLVSPHPSFFSASSGFYNSRPFTTVNANIPEPISWRL